MNYLRYNKIGAKSIVFSITDNDSFIQKAIGEGANGYITKNTPPCEIADALKETVKNGHYFKKEIAGYYYVAIRERAGMYSKFFSEKEMAILQLCYEGLTSEEIGRRLNIGKRTVDENKEHMMERVKVHNMQGVIRFAISHGLVLKY